MATPPFLAAVLFVLFIAAGQAANARTISNKTKVASIASPLSLWEVIQSRPELSTLAKMVKDVGLESMLNGTSAAAAVTMLLPVNDAFTAFFSDMGSSEAEELRANQTLPILLYHMHGGRLMQADLTPNTAVLMKTGSDVVVNSSWYGTTEVRDNAGRTADVLSWDLVGGPSVGHTINSVLLPVSPSNINEALAWSNFSIFSQVAAAAGYGAYFNSSAVNVTVLVPTDEAFEDAMQLLNVNMSSLLANKTLCKYLAAPHILAGQYPWWKLQNSQMTYLPTITSCATLFFEQDDFLSPMFVYGEGSVGQQSATLVEVDLVAGPRSLLHVIDKVLLPLSRWGKCRYVWA